MTQEEQKAHIALLRRQQSKPKAYDGPLKRGGTYDRGKRCFAYCGPEHCNCDIAADFPFGFGDMIL